MCSWCWYWCSGSYGMEWMCCWAESWEGADGRCCGQLGSSAASPATRYCLLQSVGYHYQLPSRATGHRDLGLQLWVPTTSSGHRAHLYSKTGVSTTAGSKTPLVDTLVRRSPHINPSIVDGYQVVKIKEPTSKRRKKLGIQLNLDITTEASAVANPTTLVSIQESVDEACGVAPEEPTDVIYWGVMVTTWWSDENDANEDFGLFGFYAKAYFVGYSIYIICCFYCTFWVWWRNSVATIVSGAP